MLNIEIHKVQGDSNDNKCPSSRFGVGHVQSKILLQRGLQVRLPDSLRDQGYPGDYKYADYPSFNVGLKDLNHPNEKFQELVHDMFCLIPLQFLRAYSG